MNYLSEPPVSAELVVIGGGVVGAATAFHAARAGLSGVLIEARPALCTLTTPVAAGAFRLQFDNLEELRLVRESVELFGTFEETTRQTDYRLDLRRQGYLWLARSELTMHEQKRLVAQLHGWGQNDVELLDGDETRARFPFVGPSVLRARYRAGDGFVDTKALTFGLAAGAKSGVVLDCRATGFEVDAGRLTAVQTNRGRIATGAAVIACGPLSGRVAGVAGLELPIVTVRRHKLWVPALDVVPSDAPMTIDEDTGTHWRPALGGAWLLYTDPGTPPSPPSDNVPVDPRFAFQLLDPASPVSVARTVPFWEEVWRYGARQWVLQAGQYTVTPDHRPFIGATEIDGLHVNTGYSGHGIMLAPAGGRVMAEVLTGDLKGEDNPFSLHRSFERRRAPTL
jgi:sarcosine oxidase subunit beta